MSTTLTDKSLASEDEKTRNEFLSRWNAYTSKLASIEKEVARRTKAGFSLEKRMPEQKEILSLSEECQRLSDEWHGYGKSNLSCFYSFFIKIYEISEVSFYKFEQLHFVKSNDGYINTFDYKRKEELQNNHHTKVLLPYLSQGGLLKGGRSPIDNTNLSNVMLPDEARAFLAMQGLKKFLLKLSYFRKKYGTKEDWGQMPETLKSNLWNMVTKASLSKKDSDKSGSTYDVFYQVLKQRPGEFFINGRVHIRLLGNALKTNKLKLFARSNIENQTPTRYWCKSWERKLTLENVIGDTRVVIRPMLSQETSRNRANQGHYQPMHGLFMSSSGLVEGLALHGSILYETGIPLDGSASSVSNLHCDIEKIMREAYFLNPKSKHLLPGECFLTVGQNCVSGSSIKQTQHTQVSAGSLRDFPIYDRSTASPKYYDAIESVLDLVPVGNGPDSFCLKIKTKNPEYLPLLKCLNDLKMSLLDKFGGIEKIDFHFHVIPDGCGEFVIIFSPLCRLHVQSDGSFLNQDTGKTNKDLDLISEHIHLANGRGHIALDHSNKNVLNKAIEESHKSLKQLWDFAAKPGAKEHVMQFLQKAIGYKTERLDTNRTTALHSSNM